MDLWNKRIGETEDDSTKLENKILELKASARATAEKIKFLSSEIAIKYLEEDLIKIESEIKELEQTRTEKMAPSVNMELVMANIKYYLEHLEELVLNTDNPTQSMSLFSLIFVEKPTYEELSVGTPKIHRIFKLNDASKENCEPNDILHRLREFVETFLSMKILPDLIWWLQPELASKMPERKI